MSLAGSRIQKKRPPEAAQGLAEITGDCSHEPLGSEALRAVGSQIQRHLGVGKRRRETSLARRVIGVQERNCLCQPCVGEREFRFGRDDGFEKRDRPCRVEPAAALVQFAGFDISCIGA